MDGSQVVEAVDAERPRAKPAHHPEFVGLLSRVFDQSREAGVTSWDVPPPGAFHHRSHFVFTRLPKEGPLPIHTVWKLCSRTRWGLGCLIVCSSFRIQEGRNFSPGRAWKRAAWPGSGRREALDPEPKCALWDGNLELGLFSPSGQLPTPLPSGTGGRSFAL